MPLPDALKRAIGGEALLGSLKTGGQRAFMTPEGEEHAVPIWCLFTDQRAWFVAAFDTQRWRWAEGDPALVRLEKGWTRDALHIGTQRCPLRQGTRSVAAALLDRWRHAEPSGAPLHPPTPAVDRRRAAVARGARSVPPWLAEGVPADPADRWLHAMETRSLQPFHPGDGRVARAPVWIAHSERQQLLAALGPHGPWWQPFTAPLLREARSGSDLLTAGPRSLWGARLFDAPGARASAISEVEGPERWRVAAELALRGGEVRDAVRLCAEALDLGHTSVWPMVSRLLFATGAVAHAAAAAARSLAVRPGLRPATLRWTPLADAKAARRDKVDASYVKGLLRGPVSELEELEIPATMPWPPTGPEGLWAPALASLGRHEEALSLWPSRPHLVSLQARACLLTEAQRPEAAAAWDALAEARHQAGDIEALADLQRGIDLDPSPARHWLRAQWAWAQGDAAKARQHWTAAMRLDPEGTRRLPLPPEAERALARHATEEGEARHAATAWARSLEAEPDHREAWLAEVALWSGPLEEPAHGAARLKRWAERYDALTDPPGARWRHWVQLAGLYQRAGDPVAATQALHEALAGDFLQLEAYDAALAVAEALKLPTSWWRHLRSLLAGGPAEGAPRSPSTLNAEALDALHPGGVGWTEQLRQRLHAGEEPARADLTRGLERLGAQEHPEAWRALDEVCRALNTPRPEVYVFRGEGAWGCSAWATDPPILLLGVQHLRPGPRHLEPTALRYLLAVELTHLVCGHPVLSFDTTLVGTSRSAYQAFGSYAGTAENVVDVLVLVPGIDQLAKLQALITLSRRVFATRAAVDKVSSLASPVLDKLGLQGLESAGGVGREALAGASLQLRIQADRAALRLTGDAHAAAQAILRSSAHTVPLAEELSTRGLAWVLSQTPDQTLRLTALLDFAISLPLQEPT